MTAGKIGGPRRVLIAPGVRVPVGLVVAGSWAWRLVFIAVAAYFGIEIVRRLALVVLAILGALLFTALLQPVAGRLQRLLPGPLAALSTLLLGLTVLAGVGFFIVRRAIADMPHLVDQFIASVQEARNSLQNLLSGSRHVDQVSDTLTDWLMQQRSSALDIVTTSAGYLARIGTGLVLALFVTFFLLYQSERIWSWLLSAFGETGRRRCDRAGRIAWQSITGYVRGTVTIATIHGVVIGLVLLVLGTPLAAPLALLVFFGSFIPLIGALIAGGLAVVVTFTSHGWLPALILLGVLITMNQLEGNVLQPMIMGHSVRLHPLAIGLVVTAGTLLFGIVGALVAVPLVASAYRAAPALFGRDDGSRVEPDPPPAG